MYQEIYIGNVLESYWKSYELLPTSDQEYWTNYDSLDNNRSLLYGGDDKVVVTPYPISSVQYEFITKLANWKNVLNLSPQQVTSSISLEICRDRKMWQDFTQIIRQNPGIKIIPYRQTHEFYQLINQLSAADLNFTTPETPASDNRFIESYFHTKRGFRHLWEIIKDPTLAITIPFGFITADKPEAIDAAYWLCTHQKNIVLKYNKGVQGVGVLFFDYQSLPQNKDQFTNHFLNLLNEEIWTEPVIIVEEKVDMDYQYLGGSPNVEMSIDESGHVHRQYICQQLIADDHKTFLGVSMNQQVSADPKMEVAFKAAELYGQKLSMLGYRGFFDMDLAVAKDGRLFALESNLRRTGGTHVHLFAQTLLGPNYWQRHCVISKDIKISSTSLTPGQVFVKLNQVLYNSALMQGVIIINADMARVGVIPLMVVASDINSGIKLLQQAEQLLI